VYIGFGMTDCIPAVRPSRA